MRDNAHALARDFDLFRDRKKMVLCKEYPISFTCALRHVKLSTISRTCTKWWSKWWSKTFALHALIYGRLLLVKICYPEHHITTLGYFFRNKRHQLADYLIHIVEASVFY